jgi:hypothetical protein
MRAYVITTGIIFALITISHLARLAMESTHILTEPIFLFLTILSTALAVWAFLLLRRFRR